MTELLYDDFKFEVGSYEGRSISVPYLSVSPTLGGQVESSKTKVLIPPAIFANFGSRDVLGIAHAAAMATGGTATYIMWPGSGAPLPEDKGLRKDILRHGTTSVASAVAELLNSNMCFAPQPTVLGFSMGAVRGLALAAESNSCLPSRVIGLDSAALSEGPITTGSFNYFRHLRGQKRHGLTTSATDKFYASTEEAYRDYLRAAKSKGLVFTPTGRAERGMYQAAEGANIFRSPYATGLPFLRSYFSKTNVQDAPVEVDMHFVTRTFALDKRSVCGLNDVAWELAAMFPDAKLRFSQGLVGEWHDEARKPEVIKWALGYAATQTTSLLSHIYYSSVR